MPKPKKTLTGKALGGTQMVLSALGLSGAVEGLVGLGDIAVGVIALYLTASRWLVAQIGDLFSVTPPAALLHYFLLGAPFWTVIFFGVRRVIRVRLTPPLGWLGYAWEVFRIPTYAFVAVLAAAPPGKRVSQGHFKMPPKDMRPELRKKWRDLRRKSFSDWFQLSVKANAIRFVLAGLIAFIGFVLALFPMMMVLAWPIFLFAAILAKLRNITGKAPVAIAREAPRIPDPFHEVRDRALDRFGLAIVLFLVIAAVSVGLKRNGGFAAIVDDMQQKLEEALD